MSHTVSIQPIHDGSVSCRVFPPSQTSLPCCGHNRGSRYHINISNISLGSQISQPRQMMENQGNLSFSSLKLADIYTRQTRMTNIHKFCGFYLAEQDSCLGEGVLILIFAILLFLAYYHLIVQTKLPEILVINDLLTQCLACLHL